MSDRIELNPAIWDLILSQPEVGLETSMIGKIRVTEIVDAVCAFE